MRGERGIERRRRERKIERERVKESGRKRKRVYESIRFWVRDEE